MEKSTKGKIISTLRRLTFSYPPRNRKKKKSQVGPALFKCDHCNALVYEGSSDSNYEDILKSHPSGTDIVRGKVAMDHIDPVVCVFSGFTNWDDYINRMFCEEEGFQALCPTCDEFKRFFENLVRKENKVVK